MKDPIVEEIRRIRDEHAKKFNYDLRAICEDFKQHQRHCGHPLVRLKSKPVVKAPHHPDAS
ncbi:MAG: hypothetical protein EA420_19910 [Candidatus Competibacteraceae bacterium]|nr:MAG: hypothetical protein EA420_19910 [Candidatus Competibacteraceae bacterium]